MGLSNDVLVSTTHYYNTLNKLGYLKYNDVFKLLVYQFIVLEYLTKGGLFTDVLDEEGYNLAYKALNCLYGTTCIIPYPAWKYNLHKSRNAKGNVGKERITEIDDIDRITEDETVRVTQKNTYKYVAVNKNT